MALNDYFENYSGIVWVQPDGPNTLSYPLLCSDLDGLDEPQGDVTGRFCRDGAGNWVTVNRSQGTPGEVTGDIVSWLGKTRAWLEKMRASRCAFPVYIHHVDCGREDVFLNYEIGKLLANAFITSKSSGQNVRRRADQGENAEKVEITYSLSAQPNSEEYYKLLGTVGDAQNEDEPLRDIIACTLGRCAGVCGPAEGVCQEMQVVADSAASPATANTYSTDDYASTWTTGLVDPFAGGEAIASVVCVQTGANTERLIVALGTTRAGGPMVVNYSDDAGVTWEGEVTVGATDGEYAMHSGALFALDYRHIWLCTSEANVYFSSDAGLTWTLQGVPDAGASEVLYYVHFANENYGWSVGGQAATSGHFIQTSDGGAHWSLAAAEPEAKEGVWVSVIDSQRVWVGTASGVNIWYSLDWGATWTERNLPEPPTETGDGRFWDEHAGFIGGYKTISAAHYPVMYRTFDGGYEWEVYTHATAFSTTPSYYGINAIQVCGYNVVHAVGEQLDGGHSLVWTLKPAGETWD